MILQGDALEKLKELPDESVDCIITSPPYYALRDYGVEGQIGLESTPPLYVERLTTVFRECRRVLKPQGTLWLNIGDSYWGSGSLGWDFTEVFTAHPSIQTCSKGTYDNTNIPSLKGNVDGYKNKDLIGIPWLLAFALRADGWYLRQDIIWAKPNPMPESVTDRCTKSHEYIFLFSKSPRYYFDNEAIKEEAACYINKDANIKFGGNKYGENNDPHYQTYSGNAYEFTGKRNKRDVWNIPVKPISEAHFATFPEQLVEPCILAGCPKGGTVLDPFFGSGTTGVVATAHERNYIGIELNPEYIKIAEKRLSQIQLSLF